MNRFLSTGILIASFAFAESEEKLQPAVQFEKTGRVILDLGGSGSFDECHAKYPSVIRVGDEWRMYYNGRAKNCFTGAIGYATSQDGLNWERANGGRAVLRPGPEGSAYSTKVDHPTVLKKDGQYHMWFTMGDQQSRYTVGHATSRDGIDWRISNDGKPVIDRGGKGGFDAGAVMHPTALLAPDGLIHLWYFGRPDNKSGFSIGHATSCDGVTWKKSNDGNPVLTPGMVDGAMESAVYNCAVLLEDGVFRMWYTAAYKQHMKNFAERSGGITYREARTAFAGRRIRRRLSSTVHPAASMSIRLTLPA
ncbi:MAG: hypothetical protein CMO80_24255 [Verrucomicrobiales bacterium]|nr:hypothetical protein [Verrucomicrobiales bacterium]|tara:strand:+ start:13060 stop:13980 length:921 start_codon:yes stop_codon:yes gene_type:complete